MKFRIPVLLILIFLSFFNFTLEAKDDFETFGDVGQIVLPSAALLTTFVLNDKVGRNEFIKSFALSQGSVYALKYAVQEERPNKADYNSFPSGHTSSAFCSAGFIHKRYGIKYAILPYIFATLVGISRVDSKWHYEHDVIVGAFIGIFSNYLFVSNYNKYKLNISQCKDGAMLNLQFNNVF